MSDEPAPPVKGSRLLAAFSHPGFTPLWVAAVLFYLALALEQVAVGWLVLDETGSAFLTAMAFAVRVVPEMIFGPVTGAIADRYPRSQVLILSAVIKTAALALTFALLSLDSGAIALLFVLVALSGVSLTLNTAAFGAIIPDLVGEANTINATSFVKLGQLGLSLIGALAAGLIIAWADPAAVILLACFASLVAGWGFSRVPSMAPAHRPARPVWSEAREGLRLVVKIPIVAAVLSITAAVEVLGFSFLAILPVLAEQTLDVGPEGLGALTAASWAGALLGAAALAQLGDFKRKGALLLASVFGFGLLLIPLDISEIFLVSMVVIAAVSVVAAMVDTLEWALSQAGVPSELRGRAFGAWSAVAGLGWIGPLLLGAITGILGVQAALAISGGALAVAAIFAMMVSPRLRNG